MNPQSLQVARPASAPQGDAGLPERLRDLSPASRLLAAGICLLVVGCASNSSMFPGWMSKDSGKAPRSEPSSVSPQSPAAEVGHVQSPPSEASKVRDQNDVKKDAGQALVEYANGLSSGKDAEKQGDLDQARMTYERLIRTLPGRYEAYHRLGVVADRQRRYEEALSLYTQAIHLNHGNPELFNDLGYCYYLQGHLDKAESALSKAVAMRPAEPRFRNNLGLVYGQQRRYELALEQYRRAGGEGDAYYNLAFVKASQGDFPGAKDCFRRALAADPTHVKARQALTSFENAEGQPEDLAKMSALADGETNWVSYVEKDGKSADAAKAGTADALGSSDHAAAAQHSATHGLIDRAQTNATMSDQTMSR